MSKVLTQLEVLNRPFDMTTHKSTFINYLEVVVTENGTILYAHPSHNDVMARIAKLRGVNSEDCPRERWFDYDGWLREVSGCVCVWNDGVMGVPNEAQERSLETLRNEGLLRR